MHAMHSARITVFVVLSLSGPPPAPGGSARRRCSQSAASNHRQICTQTASHEPEIIEKNCEFLHIVGKYWDIQTNYEATKKF
jgi:hypothetical protein